MFSIYIHIPFCIQKCLYCDFLSVPVGEADRKSYLKALHAEITAESVHYKNNEVNTVFLGGGTPSVLTGEQTAELLAHVRSCFQLAPDAEITTELNPSTVTADKLDTYRRSGINRLSIGLQSSDDTQLRELGRIHTWREFEECWNMVRASGFSNVNVDLMSALPDQTLLSWEQTLHRVCALPKPPEHISAYSLIIEEGTPFYEKYGENAPEESRLPDEEEDRLIYHKTKEILKEYGYRRYEISNYAKPGCQCRHNVAYWRRTNYAGFGLGAASMIENVRWKNETGMEDYISTLRQGGSVKKEIQQLTINEQMEEFCFLGLRLTKGINRQDFKAAFNLSIEDVYGPQIQALKEKGLILQERDDIRLSEYGIDLSNYVFTNFLQS